MSMLKKEQMSSGLILEVLPVIQDGLPGYAIEPELHTKEHLLIARDPGGLDNCWTVPSGTRLELVDGPRRRSRFNTAIVRVCDQPEIVGHVYWAELRASTRVVSQAD